MTILYVDDDSDDAEIFCEAVHEVDPSINCTTFPNGNDIISDMSSPDFLFLDFRMPILGGQEILRRLKENQSFVNTKIIMYSTVMSDQDMRECRELGVYDCLKKSSGFDDLCNELRKILII